MPTEMAQNALSSLSGNIEKAVIKIADDRLKDGQLVKQNAVKAQGGATSNTASLEANTKLVRLAARKAAETTAKLAKSIMSKLQQLHGDAAASMPEYQAAKKDLESANAIINGDAGAPEYDKVYVVQFNPSSLSLSSYAADSEVEIQDYQKNGNGITKGAVALHVELSVQLIFDRVVPTEAFTEDFLNYSPSAIVKRAGNAIIGAIAGEGGEVNSVQTQIEGFMAAMRNERTRRICFEWGKLSYAGVLRNVSGAYTMFDRYGKPVRGTVTLKLYLRDKNVSPTDMGYWESAYNKAFSSSNGIIGTTRPGQALGSVLGGLY